MTMNSTITALGWGALGTLLFTITYASGKLTAGDVPAFQIMFIRYVSGFITVLTIACFSKTTFSDCRSIHPYLHLSRSFCGSMGAICIIHASVLSPIADVTALGLTDGLLTVLLSVLFLGERLLKLQLIGGVLCCLGAFIVVYGSGNHQLFSHFSMGLPLALIGALLISIESILIKLLASIEKPLSILLYVNLISVFFMAVPAAYTWSAMSLEYLAFFVLLGPIAISAQFCWVTAYRLEDVAVVTPVNYLWIVFAAILGHVFFDEALGMNTASGSLLIVLGGTLLARKSSAGLKSIESLN